MTEPFQTDIAGQTAEDTVLVDEATDEVLRLHLDQFEGPFEVLLYLIKVQEIDIFDIPILKITHQYLRFLEMMEEEDLDVTGEFLVMAATLIQIKSRMLLPPDADAELEDDDLEDEDPRLDLVQKLIEYRQYRDLTSFFGQLEEARAAWYTRDARPLLEPSPDEEELLEVTLFDLTEAFRRVLHFFTDDLVQTIEGEGASVDEKIELLEQRLAVHGSVAWTDLFKECRSRVELVCCFLAILELCRMGRLRVHQTHAFEDIRLFPRTPQPATIEPLLDQ